MTIDEAITIDESIKELQKFLPDPEVKVTASYDKAARLGIEALKGILSLRRGHGRAISELLPGEKEEAHSSTG